MNIHKLLGSVALTVVVVVGGPYVLSALKLMPPLEGHAWIILFVAAVSLTVKAIVGDYASGEFLWHKYGYDNCVMAFGAILSMLALQLSSKEDLFKGLDSIFAALPIFAEAKANRSMQLFIGLLFALVATLLTAAISGAIKKNTATAPTPLSVLNALIGTVLLASYVLVLISKG